MCSQAIDKWQTRREAGTQSHGALESQPGHRRAELLGRSDRRIFREVSIVRRLFGAGAEALIIVILVFGLLALPVLAAKGGGGQPQRAVATCVVDGNVVSSTALPTDQILNFMVTDGSGTTGWALGFTLEGWWNVSVPGRSGPTTYEFASRTSGAGGARYEVFASCSAS